MSAAVQPPPLPGGSGPPPVPLQPGPLHIPGKRSHPPSPQGVGLSIKESAALAGLPTAKMRMGQLVLEGQIEGRLVKAMVAAVSRTKHAGQIQYRQRVGTRFTLEIPCSSCGRMVIAYHTSLGRVVRWLNKKGGLHPVEGEVPSGHLGVWSHEPPWSQRLLSSREVVDKILRLLPAETSLQTLAIQVYPDRIVYTCMASEGQIVNLLPDWIEASVRLGALLERAPHPTTQHRPGWMERHPILLVVLVIAAFLAFAIFGTLLLVGLAVLIAG